MLKIYKQEYDVKTKYETGGKVLKKFFSSLFLQY